MAKSVLEDEILEGLERIEQLEVATGQARQRLEGGRAEHVKVKDRVSGELSVLEADIARVRERLTAAEVNIPATLRHDYDRVVQAKGADALAPVEEGVCTGCGQQITLNSLNEMSMGRTGFCRACGRLLYLPE
jgi:predicted  nucleic acid-binding Zn-ribbon protein